MAPWAAEVAEAYSLLGLKEGCTLDELKAAYKQQALRTHPDKSFKSPGATQEFQRVGEAYKVIESHLERLDFDISPNFPAWFSPFFDFGEVDGEDIYDYFYSDIFEYNYFSDSDSDDHESDAYYRTSRDGTSKSGHYRCGCPPHEEESLREYEARLKRSREEQFVTEARRAAEAVAAKKQRAKEREREKANAEKRQKAKAAKKKAEAEVQRKKAGQTV
ncbi:hypothetical protein AN958_08665 [Leucoagaricus sp. SymC.cos]|nr:hypothetical protein AN958_08665 [Leucoagaricus sp. SymC.cos]